MSGTFSAEKPKETLKILLEPETLEVINSDIDPLHPRDKTLWAKAKYLRREICDSFSDNEDLVIVIFVLNERYEYNYERTVVEMLSKGS